MDYPNADVRKKYFLERRARAPAHLRFHRQSTKSGTVEVTISVVLTERAVVEIDWLRIGYSNLNRENKAGEFRE